ncbi:MAG: hypothetical protein M5U26_12820 [Planctomycetota bacterium]|nr:hypothetical protein [Planctomycetota bacterium]
MNAQDHERHNEEVREVWNAYRERKPLRTPCVIGTNTRFFLLGRAAPFPHVDFRTYTEDPDVMFETQVRCDEWKRMHILQDAPMGLPGEETGWTVNVDFQNFYEAAWFGCPVVFFEGQVPAAEPRWRDKGLKHEILNRGLPDPFEGLMGKAREYYEFFLEKSRNYAHRGLPVRRVQPKGLGTDGPLTVAVNLRGATELFEDFVEDPEYVRELLALVTDAIVARIRAWRRYLGQPETQERFGFADDAVQMLSKDMYKEFILPCHKRLRAGLCSTERGGSVHMCGNASRHFPALHRELGIDSFDTGFPVNFTGLRRELGPEVEIYGGPHVELMRSGTPRQVFARAREILESGILEGGRFVLREGNNLAPDTPLENISALYQAAKEHGRYDRGQVKSPAAACG